MRSVHINQARPYGLSRMATRVFILLFTNEGDVVLDPFLGSGTTYRVAARLNRVPVGIKIDETTPMRLESNACLDF